MASRHKHGTTIPNAAAQMPPPRVPALVASFHTQVRSIHVFLLPGSVLILPFAQCRCRSSIGWRDYMESGGRQRPQTLQETRLFCIPARGFGFEVRCGVARRCCRTGRYRTKPSKFCGVCHEFRFADEHVRYRVNRPPCASRSTGVRVVRCDDINNDSTAGASSSSGGGSGDNGTSVSTAVMETV